MADISTELARILSAIYGEDVRGSIHDAIEKINDVSEVVLTTGTAVTGPSSSSEGFYKDSLYLNTDNMELWKCTGVNTWVSQGTLKGDPGEDGENGNGIASIVKTSTSGLVDTYTITYTDGTTTTFNVTNGEDGTDGANGNKWYRGTGISGKAALPTVYPDSGVEDANSGDMFLNPSEGAVYSCVTGGIPTVATWQYEMTLSGGGGGGTSDYPDLTNKPQINGIELNGNLTAAQLGFATVATSGLYANLTGQPSINGHTLSGNQTGADLGLASSSDIPTVDQTYDPTSDHAQSGTAVADALTDYYNKEEIDEQEKNLVSYGGAVTFANLPALSAANVNKFWLVTDSFTTTSDFVVGAGVAMPADSHIAIINTGTDASPVYKYDDFGGFVDTSALQTKAISSMSIKGSSVSTVTNALTALNSGLDAWTSTATVSSSGTVTFTGLNDNYGYELYCQNKLIGISAMNKTGSGTSVQIVYTVTGAASGDVCKLRILK